MLGGMKHAGPATLDALAPLLEQIRALPGLREPKTGVFYRKSRAFLHFHEDPKGLFADVRDHAGSDFDRLDVSDEAGRAALLVRLRASLGPPEA